MVKGPNKKTSLSKLKEKKSITNEREKKKNFTRNLVFLKKAKDKSEMTNLNCWPVI